MNEDPEPELSDSMLLDRFAETGDSGHFERLYRRHRRLVFAASRAVLGNDDSAEDAVGATFVLLSKHAGVLARRPSVAGWLYQTATLVAKNLKRQEEAQLRKLYRYGATARGDDRVRPAEQLEVSSCLSALPTSSRKAVLLRFFGGLSYAEVGKALNCSEDAARQRIHRSLEALGKMLGSSGLVMTTDQIEETLRNLPQETAGPGLSGHGAKLAETFERATRLARIRLATIGVGAVVIAVPAFNSLALGGTRPGKSVPTVLGAAPVAGPTPPSGPRRGQPQAPGLSRGFTLVYKEVSRSSGTPDVVDQLTLSYDGSTLLTKRGAIGRTAGVAIGLIKGYKEDLYLSGSSVSFGNPLHTSKWIEWVEDDMDTIDPARDTWRHEAEHSQAPPLTRFTLVTNIPPVGVSLPEPFSISLDGSYSWFMGDSKQTTRDAQGRLTHFGAYDTTYDLSDYRKLGDVEVAGRVVVRRSQGDFGGPNEYTLKSASASPLPAAEFRPDTYRKGELLASEKSPNPGMGINRVYIRPDTPQQVKAQLKAVFWKPSP